MIRSTTLRPKKIAASASGHSSRCAVSPSGAVIAADSAAAAAFAAIDSLYSLPSFAVITAIIIMTELAMQNPEELQTADEEMEVSNKIDRTMKYSLERHFLRS